MARLRLDGFTLLLALIALLGAIHLLIRTSTHGPALGIDAIYFISAAENFAAGYGLRTHRGFLIDQPPLFPILLGCISLFGLEPVDAGRFVNALAVGLIILLPSLYLRRHLSSRLLVLGAAVSLMSSFSIADISSYVVTDALFTVFTLLALAPLGTVPNQQAEKRAVVLSAIFAALAIATRFIGITVLFTAALLILARSGKPLSARLRAVTAYGLIALTPFSLFVACGWINSGARRFLLRSGESLLESFSLTVARTGRILFPWTPATEHLVYPAWGAVGLAGLGCVVFVILSRNSGATRPAFNPGPFLPCGLFVLVYLVVLPLITLVATTMGPLLRYLLPASVPLLMVAAFLMDVFLRRQVSGSMQLGKWMLALPILTCCAANIGFNLHRNLEATARALEAGYNDINNFSAVRWTDSQIGTYLRTHTHAGRFYTNGPPVFRWLADAPSPIGRVREMSGDNCLAWLRRALRTFERDSTSETSGFRQAFSAFQRNWDAEETYIVWVEKSRNVRHRCTIPEATLPPALERVVSLPDGAVYRIVRGVTP